MNKNADLKIKYAQKLYNNAPKPGNVAETRKTLDYLISLFEVHFQDIQIIYDTINDYDEILTDYCLKDILFCHAHLVFQDI